MKVTLPLVAVAQSGMLLPEIVIVAPVQKISDSGIVPVKVIFCAVLAATTPLSVAPVVASDEVKVLMRTKKVQLLFCGAVAPQLVPSGLVTVNSWYEVAVFIAMAAALVR